MKRKLIVDERQRAGVTLRQLGSGRLHVIDFEELMFELTDTASWNAFTFAWYHYDDFKTTHLTGRWRLKKESRRKFARWSLYLATNGEPYPWRDIPVGGNIRSLLALIGFKRLDPFLDTGIDQPHWPFRSEAELKDAERQYLVRVGLA